MDIEEFKDAYAGAPYDMDEFAFLISRELVPNTYEEHELVDIAKAYEEAQGALRSQLSALGIHLG